MRAPTQHFHVSEAYLCPCGMIGNSAMQCACGQEQGLLQLSTVLDQAPAVEYEVRGMADGIARGLDFARPDQLRSLGNMVVPLEGALALLVLLDRTNR